MNISHHSAAAAVVIAVVHPRCEAMALRMCSISLLVLYTVRLGLLVVWLGLTGMKVKHFLSEPTAFQSRVDHEFELPYISVFHAENRYQADIIDSLKTRYPKDSVELLKARSHDIPDQSGKTEHSNQTLLEFVRDHSVTLAAMAPGHNMLSYENLKRRIYPTIFEDRLGTWRVTLTDSLDMGATLKPENPDISMRLPHTMSTNGIANERHREYERYSLVFHCKPDYLIFDKSLHKRVFIESKQNVQKIEINIDRSIRLNLRREPCEEDPAYDIKACQYRCMLNQLHCSLYRNETGGKRTCMDDDWVAYYETYYSFFNRRIKVGNRSIFPIDRCGCRQPCIQDSISYYIVSHKQKTEDFDYFEMDIRVSQVRHTKVMVLTYELEDLVADTGGYLGLLLGASLLSVFGSGRKLIRRLVRQALAKRRRRQLVKTEDQEKQNDRETVWYLNRGEEASRVNDFVPAQLVDSDFLIRFVQQ